MEAEAPPIASIPGVFPDSRSTDTPALSAERDSTPPASSPAPSWTASLLAATNEPTSPLREASRFAAGLGLASLYGLALGARQGGKAFLAHAAFVPAALLAVAALGVPALYIALALFDAPVELPRAVAASARATARAGLVLAGLAPAAALFVVSSDEPRTAAAAGIAGLVVAGSIGLLRLVGDLHRGLAEAPAATRAKADLAFFGFAVFAVALAARIWWAALPLFGGAR